MGGGRDVQLRYFGFALRRLLLAIPLLLGVAIINFLLIKLAPGDPAIILVGDYPAPPEYIAKIHADFGLDQPVWVQLVSYLGQILRGNLGYSFANRQPVATLLFDRLGATLALTMTALVLSSIVGVLVGVLAAWRQGGATDRIVQGISLTSYSVPDFWLGQMLIIVFAVTLGWLPSQGAQSLRSPGEGFAAFADRLRYLLLPACALSVRYLALIARITRSTLIDVLSAEFILASRSRGASERVVLFTHALRNAAAPVVTVIGYNLGFVLAGSALIESVFAWPGIGRLLRESIAARDYPVMLGILLLVSATVVLANLLTDIVHQMIDPRVRSG